MIDKNQVDPNALHFYRMLKEAGFSAYFVGGSVRDLLLGKVPKDFDIATNATPHQIKRVIPQGRIIGRRFRHVMLEKHGGRYEIVTFRGPVVEADDEIAELDDEALEDHPVSDVAGEEIAPVVMAGPGDRGPKKNYPDLNQFGTAEQDAKRRDFTINALFYDPDADELVDYVEGKLDIDRRLIRSIGDSMQRMEEDPIRILRAIRHKMKLSLEYDAALEAAMRAKAPLLEQTSKDRIREEFLKVCNDHSLGAFLLESRRLGLVPHIMPWFEGISEETWAQSIRLWEKLKDTAIPERQAPDLGLALMMIPLIGPLVLEPYKKTLSEAEKNYLPDMKYFLSCEPLRNYYLRNLRVSRAQTDHIVRTLFYYSRMSGLWLEQGPPRRIVGRLFQHPPALLAAKMAKIFLDLEGKETPPWIQDLADYDAGPRRTERGREGRDRGRGRDDRGPRRDSREAAHEIDSPEDSGHEAEQPHAHESENGDQNSQISERGRERDRPRQRDRDREPARAIRLPAPDQPMIWNGPLHAPVLRPSFQQEEPIRWARKNQTVRAYRPSGIPNQPVDHAILKSDLVYNYKPEIDPNATRPNEEQSAGEEGRGDRTVGNRGRRGGRDRDRGRVRGRDRDGERPRIVENQSPSVEDQGTLPSPTREERIPPPLPVARQAPEEFDEDMIGNRLRPGETPAALASDGPDYGDDDDVDDDIGNRLDAPPTSGHVGMNGEGVLGRQGGGQGRGPHGHRGGPRQGGGDRGGGGGGAGGGRRRGRRRGRRGGGSGTPTRGAPRSNHGNM